MAYLLKSFSRTARWAPRLTRLKSDSYPLVYSEEVSQAQGEGRPIVALESTIITHGMPYPHNLETALQVEDIIRNRGATPATIAILQGQMTIGLTKQQIEYLAQAKGVVKASRRDLAPITAARVDGATTVAGTLVAAELASIPVFVTGGIGGVHRDGETTMDISADLTELGRSSTLVVCSGVKSILDIGRTLEYMETQGVCVCAFGSYDFPAFYTRTSGHKAPHKVADAQDAARLLQASHTLCLGSGIVVAVPLPHENALDEQQIEDAIAGALKEAEAKGVQGKEVTPFILSAVAKATAGASLDANMALIKNNAKVGADIAVEYKKLKNVENVSNIGVLQGKFPNTPSRRFHTSCSARVKEDISENYDPMFGPHKRSDGDVLVIGGANVDRTYKINEDHLQLDGSTHACSAKISGGGVGRNIAEALWRLRGGRARLIAAIGDDADGQYLAGIAPGLILDGCMVPGARTASYAAVLDASGECRLGLGDMAVHDHISIKLVDRHLGVLEKAPLVVIDGNVPQATIDHVLRICNQLNKPVFFEPTDKRKAVKSFHEQRLITYASPNIAELREMARFIKPNLTIALSIEIEQILHLSEIVAEVVEFLIVTLGSKGVLTVRRFKDENTNKSILRAKLYPVEIINAVKSVSGAGDCFTSGFINGILSEYQEAECIYIGFESAKCALLSENTVPPNLSMNFQVKRTSFIELL